MDDALKARLIGAAVLVAVAVLLIPELLSGRKPVEPVGAGGEAQRGTRTFVIDLAGGGGRPAEPAEARAQAPSPAAPPAAGEPAPGVTPEVAPSYQTEPRTAEPERTTAANEPAPSVPGPAAPTTSAAETASSAPPPLAEAPRANAGGWAVQVGAFGSAATASGLVRKLAADGYHAFVAPAQRGGKTLHRVRVGPQPDKAGAERTAGQLKAKGLPATVVQND